MVPELTTVVAVASRADVASAAVQGYLHAIDAARDDLMARGAGGVAEVHVKRGWSEEASLAAGEQIIGPNGLAQDHDALAEGLTAAAELRQRFFPEWSSKVAINKLILGD